MESTKQPSIKVRPSNRFAMPREATEVIDGVTLLGSQRVNFFAITEGSAITLVDCGFKGHWRYLRSWLDATGRSIGDIEAIVLTHGHGDHVGFAQNLANLGIPVHLHHADIESATATGLPRPPQRLRTRLYRPDGLRLFAEAFTDGAFRQLPLVDPIPFSDGDTIDAPGGLRVVQVPGHNPGSCALYRPETESLFSGDALMTLDPMFRTVGAQVFAEDDRNDQDALDGLAHLSDYRHASLLPAHGEPWTDPGSVGKAIDTAIIPTPPHPWRRRRRAAS